MVVPNNRCKKRYTGNGVSRYFDFDFSLPEVSCLEVWLTKPGGLPEKLSGGYSVDRAARRVTYPANQDSPALPVGFRLTLLRNVPYIQQTRFENQKDFFAETHEKTFDTQEMQIQQLAEEVSRAIKVPVDDQYDTDELTSQVIDTHARYGEITQKHGEALAARDAAAAAKGAAESSEASAQAAKDLAQTAALTASAAKETVLAASSVLPWDAEAAYSYPDMACCPDGNTYRCIGTYVTGENPAESDQWVRITVIQTAGIYDMESGGTFADAAAAAVSGGLF